MTRINSAISVQLLTDEHLLAEHREIKRLPAYFVKALSSGALGRIPKVFCLGTGHVTFFVNKQLFLLTRYKQIRQECINRGFDVADYTANWLELRDDMERNNCWKAYKPTSEEHDLLAARISERIAKSPKDYFHYYGESITKQQALKLLTL